MALNAVIKGKTGEQEIARELNTIFNRVLLAHGISLPAHAIAQRNQNQSAVGGKDIVIQGMPIAIEVKRQEQLAVEAWWKQCSDAGKRNQEFPILIYRQNNRKWNVVMWGLLSITNTKTISSRVQVSFESFLAWFEAYVNSAIENGWVPRT